MKQLGGHDHTLQRSEPAFAFKLADIEAGSTKPGADPGIEGGAEEHFTLHVKGDS